MKKLNRYNLDYTTACDYTKKVINKANLLSIVLLENIELNKGKFFTLLPPDADFSRICNFDSYILKQYPTLSFKDNGKSKYQKIPNIRTELSDFIFQKIKSSEKISCVFDDVTRLSTDICQMELFNKCGFSNGKEVYYLINKGNASTELIRCCLDKSNSFWHSLCILSEFKHNEIINKQLTIDHMKKISLKAQLIIIGAYDGEGYIFWERDELLN